LVINEIALKLAPGSARVRIKKRHDAQNSPARKAWLKMCRPPEMVEK
jgi:hypothetical protein